MLGLQRYSIADHAFRPIGKQLGEELGGASVFFLELEPRTWQVSYFGMLPEETHLTSNQSAFLKAIKLQIGNKAHNTDWSPEVLFTFTEKIARLVKAEDCLAVAESILRDDPVSLGHTPLPDDGNEAVWSLRAPPKPLKVFQTALEFGAGLVTTEQLNEREKQAGLMFNLYGEANRVLGVDGYMKRRDIIDQAAAPAFLAEYLTALKGELGTAGSLRPEQVRHYFLPISGLGQWRATACWFGEAVEEDFSGRFRQSALTGLNELYTHAIIESFIQSLEDQFSHSLRFSDMSLITSFSELFWSREIVAYRGGEIQDRMCWHKDGGEDGVLVRDRTFETSCTRLDGKNLPLLMLHPEEDAPFHNVQINLLALTKGHGEELITEETIHKYFGFDTVVLRVPFLDPGFEKEIGRFSKYLLRKLSALLQLHAARASAMEREGMAAMAHFNKNWVNATGYLGAIQSLQALHKLPRALDPATTDAVANAIASLQMFHHVGAVSEMIRLWNIDADGDHGKIASWIADGLVKEFAERPEAAFQRYIHFTKDAVVTIASGLGYHLDIPCEIVGKGGTSSKDDIKGNRRPMCDMTHWIQEHDAVPPFSAQDGFTSHLVLLAVLAEPVFNAVKELNAAPDLLKNGSTKAPAPFSLKFQRKDDTAFEVVMTNLARVRPPQYIPSLGRIQGIYRKVRLAEVSHKTFEHDDHYQLAVSVLLTPLDFARHIRKPS